ncbi:unnamed protein product [Kuraishia capsulata CBS 1993]|uniref:Redoxin domain-containing protein n=1 Tax=Kuraishia capsulata CBS 1993 TaxID=1382522 RepID=W6MHV6_9ASCO|nr:uncharacterized protein KUCA_T00001586001 [Kuraishia capsulata CBS 1993]CDK25616.1 unnamed protein product [Kuraishia capsulata CBS 1993]
MSIARNLFSKRMFSTSQLCRLDVIPSVPLFSGTPDNKFELAKELENTRAIVVGVPGAFSGGCTNTHIPGYLKTAPDFFAKGYHKIYFVSVNDVFVMNAWKTQLLNTINNVENYEFLADPTGEFSKTAGLLFDATALFGNFRSKRYALVLDHGKVIKEFVEPDNTSITISAAANVLHEAPGLE